MPDFLQGIDVSQYNGVINLASVLATPAPPAFAYMKATEGSSMTDRCYATNRAAAKAQGLLCGAYHFFVPGVPVQSQVDNFVATVGSVKGELPPMLDVEQPGLPQPEYAAAIMEWLQQVGARLGCAPGIYTNTSFWDTNVGSYAPFAAAPLWIAQYTEQAAPALPQGASGYLFWQYNNMGVIRGVSGPVDLSRYVGTAPELAQLLCL